MNLKVDEEFDLHEEFDSEEDEIELKEVFTKKESPFLGISLKELHNQLEKAVDNENYELAANIRDEISKRS